MAKSGRKPAGEESIGGYFRKVFAQHPRWLGTKSNDLVLQQWQDDHPDEELTKRIRQNLANVKSLLRHKKRKRGKGAAADAVAPVEQVNSGEVALEQLEERIDDCLTMARGLGTKKLDDAIKHLRLARREVVWQQG